MQLGRAPGRPRCRRPGGASRLWGVRQRTDRRGRRKGACPDGPQCPARARLFRRRLVTRARAEDGASGCGLAGPCPGAAAMASLLAKDAYLQGLAKKICAQPGPEPRKRKWGELGRRTLRAPKRSQRSSWRGSLTAGSGGFAFQRGSPKAQKPPGRPKREGRSRPRSRGSLRGRPQGSEPPRPGCGSQPPRVRGHRPGYPGPGWGSGVPGVGVRGAWS